MITKVEIEKVNVRITNMEETIRVIINNKIKIEITEVEIIIIID